MEINNNNTDCLICLDKPELPYYLCPQCKCKFHKDCFNEYCKTKKNNIGDVNCCHCKKEVISFIYCCDFLAEYNRPNELESLKAEADRHKRSFTDLLGIKNKLELDKKNLQKKLDICKKQTVIDFVIKANDYIRNNNNDQIIKDIDDSNWLDDDDNDDINDDNREFMRRFLRNE
jgi:hypothetical protein